MCQCRDIVECSRLDLESVAGVHAQAAHLKAICADPRQYVAHLVHTTCSTWLSWSLVEWKDSSWEGIMHGKQPLMSP